MQVLTVTPTVLASTQRQTLFIFMYILASMHKKTEDALTQYVLMMLMGRGMSERLPVCNLREY